MSAEHEKTNGQAADVPAAGQSGIEKAADRPLAVPGGKDVMERPAGALAERKERQPAVKPDAAVSNK